MSTTCAKEPHIRERRVAPVSYLSVFNADEPEVRAFQEEARGRWALRTCPGSLSASNVAEAAGCPYLSCRPPTELDAATMSAAANVGVRLIVTRANGVDRIDTVAAAAHGITILKTGNQSAKAVAEHALHLLLAPKDRLRTTRDVWSLDGRTVGIVGGTGAIGTKLRSMLRAFGCRVLVTCDPSHSRLGCVPIGELLQRSDAVVLTCPSSPGTKHLIDADALAVMRPGVVVVNVARGDIVDTRALISALDRRHVGFYGTDVHEAENDVFFSSPVEASQSDPLLADLLRRRPDVEVTGHWAWRSPSSLRRFARVTLRLVAAYQLGRAIPVPCLVSDPISRAAIDLSVGTRRST